MSSYKFGIKIRRQSLPVVSSGIALLAAIFTSPVSAIDFDYSGYLRLVGGSLDDNNASYTGYDGDIGFDNHSLLGLQGRVNINESLSLTALVQGHTSDRVESGLEWLYLSYRPNDAFTIKAGQMQAPFYAISDVLDVGYAYNWVVAPRELYNDFIFKNFRGIDLTYTLPTTAVDANIEAYFGEFDDQIRVNNLVIDTEVDRLCGIIANVRWNQFSFRASYHGADYDAEIAELKQFSRALDSAGFSDSAARIFPAASADFYQASVRYDSLDNIFLSEWVNIKPNSDLFADVESYYLSFGRIFGEFTTMLTYSRREDRLAPARGAPATGISTEQDVLALGYQAVFDARVETDNDAISGVVRWDFSPSMAFKAEIKNIRAKSDNGDTFVANSGAGFDNRATLYLFALDWVF